MITFFSYLGYLNGQTTLQNRSREISLDGWMDGRTDGWTDGWSDGETDGWTDGKTNGWSANEGEGIAKVQNYCDDNRDYP